jgi:serine/threonine protein kinase
MPADPARAKSLFLAAAELPGPAERAAFLDRECGPDAELRARVDALLRAHDAWPPEGGPAPTQEYAADQFSAGQVVAGKYKLLQRIGEGGMGTVWMAEQTEPVKRRVAVKLVRADRGASRAILARFEAERQAIALTDHPHIAKLLDAGTAAGPGAAGVPYFVMELVRGVPITDFCDAHSLPVPERLRLFGQVCSAVQHAHQKGVIHRDLKPTNILVESHDGTPVPKVIDFGLAKATSGLQLTEHTLFTAFGSVVGTPLYMAPEQASFNAVDVDTRADVYALGAVLYELLTGSTPLARESLKKAALDEVVRMVREQEPPTPSNRFSTSEGRPAIAARRQTEPAKLGRFLKGELDWVVMKALSKERDRRYESAGAFARDVERFLNHEPVQAGPPGAAYRLRKFVRRNRGAVLAAALVLLALVAGVAGTGYGLYRAEQRRAEAERQRERAEAGERLAGERLKDVEEEKRLAQAVRDFLQKKLLGQADARTQANALLRDGRPSAELSLNPTVRELLDRAARELAEDRIEENFPGQPLLQAELLQTAGQTYLGVGEFEQAISLLGRAADLRKTRLGADHPKALVTIEALGLAHLAAGRPPRAVALLEQARAGLAARLGPDHPEALAAAHNLAMAYREAGEPPRAVELLEQAWGARVKQLGADHPDTLVAVNGLAGAYLAAGRLPRAVALLEQARAGLAARLGPDHPDALIAAHNLAVAYREAGRLPESIELLGRVREGQVKTRGPDHPDTLDTLHSLAVAYREAKAWDKSTPLFEDVLKRRAATVGREHPATLMAAGFLGANYRDAGRLTEAVPLLEGAYRQGLAHPGLAWVGGELLVAYVKAARTADAARLAGELLAAARRQAKPDSPQLAGALATYGWQLLEVKQFAEAEPVLRECLALREKLAAAPPPAVAAWQLANAKSLLGGALLGQKRYAEAEPLLRAGYEGLRKDERAVPPVATYTIPNAVRRLAELYDATGKKDEAARLRQELDRLQPAAPEKK